MSDLILSIDQGTTSSRAIIFDTKGNPLKIAQMEFEQFFPDSGWVEHDPEEIWSTTQKVVKKVLSQVGPVTAIGITNQRETTVVWNRETGESLYKAIVWQDGRTAEHCVKLKNQGHEQTIKGKTGLILDPYFSATKIGWILDHVNGARDLAEQGKLAFGTIDSFLIWRLTDGKVHATDATNASRTSLFNIHTQNWDEELLKIFNVPKNMLPDVLDSAADFGITTEQAIGVEIPVCGVAGDQQAASIGQCCFEPGMTKSTYGTGGFAMMNTGDTPIVSTSGLLTTVGYRLNGKTTYALEGSIFIAGAAVQWLRDKLKIIETASDTEGYARGLKSNEGVYLVPAFVGLGAPYWNPNARGAIFGLTRDSGPEHFARAALESICYQTHDLIQAMTEDTSDKIKVLKVDGGMVNNKWMCQMLADILEIEIQLPVITETTALGASYLAGLQLGLFESTDSLSEMWQKESQYNSGMDSELRNSLLGDWKRAVASVSSMSER
ncbi:MAG: glycerol kinase GlpK [Gammaproteobacteria bacterium]|jgi:glycerol kinase|nr:glycerol kinase GlpK [Gammaproteobacteria bacterium]